MPRNLVGQYSMRNTTQTVNACAHTCTRVQAEATTITNDPSLSDRTNDALTAAKPYYVQDHLTMEAIAHELHTSRSSVSRLLRQARANGLVNIQIRSPLNATSRLEKVIFEKYQVTAHVVPISDHTSDIDRRERIALPVARILGQFFDSNIRKSG